MNFLNTWQFNLLGYLFGVVVFFQCYKLAVKNAQKDGAATVLLQTIAGIAVLFLAPFFPFIFPSSISVYVLLFLACIFYGLNDRLQTTSRKHLQVSVFSILSQLSNVFLIAIGLTIFGEPFVLMKVIGAVLILCANILLFYKRGSIELNKYTWIGVFATFVFAIAVSIDIGISKQFNLPVYIMLTLLLPAFMIFFGEKIKLTEVVREYKSPNKKYYIITGIAWAFTIFFSLRCFQLGKVTTMVPLQATSVLLNVLVAYIVFGEKKDEWKKIIAAVLVVIGVYFTVVS